MFECRVQLCGRLGRRLKAQLCGRPMTRSQVDRALGSTGAAFWTTWAQAQGAALWTTYDLGAGRRTFAANDLGAAFWTTWAQAQGAALWTTYDQVAGRPRPWEHGRRFLDDLGAGSGRSFVDDL